MPKKVVQETGGGLAAKVSVLTDPSFVCPLSFSCLTWTALDYFIYQATYILMKISNLQ